MKLLSVFNQFEALANNETRDKATTRREAFTTLGKTLGKAATIALPLAAFMTPNRVAAQSSGDTVIDVLNFALLLEYLESEYYQTGLSTDSLLTGDTRETIALISQHETAHVEFLKTAINGAGGTAIDKPEFDFTVGGAFDPFGDLPTFMVLAQAFEDTGVRAYKGQAVNLMGNKDVLTAALQIHSVEARHASEIRRMRGSKGWITSDNNTTGVDAIDAVYNGEDNITQLGLDAVSITDVSRDRVTEAYDEPLSKADVTDIAMLFLG